MSLIGDIYNNTAAVRYGKLDLVEAITAQGGKVEEYEDVPTFSALEDGVYDILAVKNISGAEEAKICASEDINKGSLCNLAQVISDGAFASTIDLPTTLNLYQGGTYSVDNNGIPAILNDGEFIFVTFNASNQQPMFYPFIRTEYGYEQMKAKINDTTIEYFCIQVGSAKGGYKEYQGAINIVYDKNTDKIFSDGKIVSLGTSSSADCVRYWDIDRENKYLVPHTILNSAGSAAWTNSYSYSSILTAVNNGLCFVYGPTSTSSSSYATSRLRTIFGLPDFSTGNVVTYGYLDNKGGFNSNYYSNVALDVVNTDTHTSYVLSKQCGDAKDYNAYRVTKLNVADNTVTVLGTTTFLTKNTYGSNITLTNCNEFLVPRICMTNNGTIFAIDGSTTLHRYVLNFANMSLTETDLVFSDGLDKTKIDFCRAAKEEDYLMIVSTDEAYSEEEKHRLYKYDSNNGTYVFVCCPPLSSTPEVQALVPRNRTCNYNSINNSCFIGTDGLMRFYDFQTGDFDYYATNNTINKIGDSNAYGVATENIPSGEIGNAIVILKL